MKDIISRFVKQLVRLDYCRKQGGGVTYRNMYDSKTSSCFTEKFTATYVMTHEECVLGAS